MERGPILKIEALVMEKLEVKSDSMDERGFHLERGCWNMLIGREKLASRKEEKICFIIY